MSNKQQQAKDYLTACFQCKGFEPFFIVTKTSLLRILDNMAQQQFDRELANELFERCPTNYKGLVKIEDFIEIIIQADIVLNEKINKANEFIVKQTEELTKLTNKNRSQVLQIRVIGAKNLHQGLINATNKPYVVVHFNQEKKSSRLAHNDILNPIWDETFVFPIKTGNEQTYISILTLDSTNNKSSLIGEIHFGLRELEDQMKHNQWFNIYDRHGQMSSGSLQLELQLLLDESMFYEQAQQVMQQQILNQQEEKDQYENDLKILYSPFQNGVLQPKRLIIPDAPQLMFVHEFSKPIIYQGDKKVDLTIYKTPQLSDSRVLQILNQPPESVTTVHPEIDYPARHDLKQKANYGYDHVTQDMKLTAILILLYLLSSIYLCWVKTDFVNITIALCTSLIVGLNYFEKNHLNIFAILIILTLLYDVSWLAAYSGVWWNQNKSENPQQESDLITSQRITILVSYFVIFLKITLSCQLWNLKKNIEPLNNHKQFGIGTHLYQANGGHINPFIQ
ncbi:unnamed protein product [Paramecium pentaurelia]|uniref:C2 domain-containing protein n=1 Tax=Paramecium pentaurelia TaxID=43138 RepID=A0A8S1WQI0_9CILI|nr:unnamed protein product [Paramecium pentaurelia]